MSYSFQVRAATKDAALALVKVEMEKVAASQVAHTHDATQVEAAVEAFLGLLQDDDTMDVQIQVNGSLGWRVIGGDAAGNFNSASVGISAYFMTRPAPESV